MTIFAIATMLATTLQAQSTDNGEQALKNADDGSWIGVSGTVESTSAGSFVLDYGDGSIKVNVDPNAADPHEFKANEAVTVYGMLDEGFFKGSTINARTVYLDSQKSYACSSDGADRRVASFVPAIHTGTVIYGRVTKVSGDDFMVDEAGSMITVDASALKGKKEADVPAIHVGDHVTVVGDINEGFFSGRKLEATSLSVIH